MNSKKDYENVQEGLSTLGGVNPSKNASAKAVNGAQVEKRIEKAAQNDIKADNMSIVAKSNIYVSFLSRSIFHLPNQFNKCKNASKGVEESIAYKNIPQ